MEPTETISAEETQGTTENTETAPVEAIPTVTAEIAAAEPLPAEPKPETPAEPAAPEVAEILKPVSEPADKPTEEPAEKPAEEPAVEPVKSGKFKKSKKKEAEEVKEPEAKTEEPTEPEAPPAPIVPADPHQAVQDIINGKLDLSELDFTSAQVREIVLQCIEAKQILSRKLDANDPMHREILKQWIDEKYSNLLILNKEQRHSDLINSYLEHKFQERLQKWESEKNELLDDVSVEHSYTGQQVIRYNYETKEGEAISYFDNSLGIPVRLKTQATLKIKITNALSLVKGLDMELERIDFGTLITFIGVKVNNCLRDAVLGTIEAKKIGYYDLPRFYSTIRDKLASSLQALFSKCGLTVTDVILKDISLTNNATEKFEKQYYALAEIARIKEFENKLEAASLKLYEQKAMIHDKYQNFPAGLTEAEKDLALNRYLKRIGQDKELVVEDITQDELKQRAEVGEEEVTDVELVKPEPPKAPVPSNTFRVLYAIFGAVWLAVGAVLTVMFLSQIYIGAAVLGAGVLAIVIAGIVGRHKLRYGMSKSTKLAYEAKLAEYKKDLEDYNGALKPKV